MRTNRDWVAALPEALGAQRRLLAGFLDHCERTPMLHAEGIVQARYGVTALFDLEAPRLPEGVECTLAGLGLTELAGAGHALGELLEATERRLVAAGAELPDELARFVLADLAQLKGVGRPPSALAASPSTPGG